MKTFVAASAFVMLGLMLWPGSAHAGRRPYVIGYDTPIVPTGDVELESWLDLVSNKPDSEYRWWLGPTWAPIDGVEVSIMTIITQGLPPVGSTETATSELWAEQVQARWRVVRHPLLGDFVAQAGFRLPTVNDLPYQASGSVNWIKRSGRFAVTAQGGYAHGWGGPKDEPGKGGYRWIVWNAGAAVDVVKGEISPPLQIGVEAFGEQVLYGLNDLTDKKSIANAGPTLSVARGRVWVTLGALFALTEDSPEVFARGNIGMAF